MYILVRERLEGKVDTILCSIICFECSGIIAPGLGGIYRRFIELDHIAILAANDYVLLLTGQSEEIKDVNIFKRCFVINMPVSRNIIHDNLMLLEEIGSYVELCDIIGSVFSLVLTSNYIFNTDNYNIVVFPCRESSRKQKQHNPYGKHISSVFHQVLSERNYHALIPIRRSDWKAFFKAINPQEKKPKADLPILYSSRMRSYPSELLCNYVINVGGLEIDKQKILLAMSTPVQNRNGGLMATFSSLYTTHSGASPTHHSQYQDRPSLASIKDVIILRVPIVEAEAFYADDEDQDALSDVLGGVMESMALQEHVLADKSEKESMDGGVAIHRSSDSEINLRHTPLELSKNHLERRCYEDSSLGRLLLYNHNLKF